MGIIYKNLKGTTSRQFTVGVPSDPQTILGTYAHDEYEVPGSTTNTTPPGDLYKRFTTPILDPGKYLINATVWISGTTTRDLTSLLIVDGVTLQSNMSRVVSTGSGFRYPHVFHKEVEITTGGATHNIDINYYTSGGTMYMNGSSITIQRVK